MTNLMLFMAFGVKNKRKAPTTQHRQHMENLLVLQSSPTWVTPRNNLGENFEPQSHISEAHFSRTDLLYHRKASPVLDVTCFCLKLRHLFPPENFILS